MSYFPSKLLTCNAFNRIPDLWNYLEEHINQVLIMTVEKDLMK